MIYKAFLALILSLLAPLSASAMISNVIIFGDSYSDIGNFPEASSTLIHPRKPRSLSNFNSMLYVPVSNPVNPSLPYVNIHHYPIPDLKNNHLPPQPKIDGQTRAYRSLSWTEFLTTDLYADHLIRSPNISPSISVENSPHPFAGLNMSVNYAWSSATSRATCTYYGGFKSVPSALCNEKSIQQARQVYLRDPSYAHLKKIIVPGMRRQIELFLKDLKSKKVRVNAKTDYVLEIGGNDLLDAGAHFQIVNTRYMAANVYYGAYRLLSQIPKGNVFIFTLANPDLTPFSGIHGLLGWMGAHYAKTYNTHLREILAQLNQQFPGRVHLVDEYQIFQDIAAKTQASYFQKACQLRPTPNCQGYAYWNAVHPSSSTEAIFGYDVAKRFKESP